MLLPQYNLFRSPHDDDKCYLARYDEGIEQQEYEYLPLRNRSPQCSHTCGQTLVVDESENADYGNTNCDRDKTGLKVNEAT